MRHLWMGTALTDWRDSLASYPDVIARQGVARLPELDAWYREELPAAIAAHLTLPELVRVTEWKMARGVWRAPNLVLVRGNAAATVEEVSGAAFAAVVDGGRPIALLASLDGVGPATASAVLAAAAPSRYPFFDELVAGKVPDLGPVKWTLSYYVRYAEALRTRASELGDGWTPVMVERALWASVGGKAGLR